MVISALTLFHYNMQDNVQATLYGRASTDPYGKEIFIFMAMSGRKYVGLSTRTTGVNTNTILGAFN